ncbi:ABC transporter permease [Microvirga zambiensis]|uniref:ABC transporter permease n=1 Tax=Microvirga zambiensis TaxID=1402137 RepID=UPI00191DA405|nr:ABC transporter permease [Microvirga zambiensis]
MQNDITDKVMATLGVFVRATVYVMLILPAVIVVIASLTQGDSLSFPPKGFSTQWYSNAFASTPFMSALWTSTKLAVTATVIVLSVGSAAAFAIARYRFIGSSLFQSIALSPLIVPVVVLGLGLLQFLSWMGFSQSYLGLFVGHLIIMLPYVVRTMVTGLLLLDRTLEQAAMNLRAPPFRVFCRITLPLLVPSLITAGVFAFVTSFGNVTLSSFLASSGTVTLPVQIFTYVEYSYDPIVAAVSTIVIAVTAVVILVIERAVGVDKLF